MNPELAKYWKSEMAGLEPNVLGVADALLGAAARSGSVRLRMVGANVLEIAVGTQVDSVSDDGMVVKFRMVCARLAVIMRTPTESLYGGAVSRHLLVDGVSREVHLEFKNSPDGWLKCWV